MSDNAYTNGLPFDRAEFNVADVFDCMAATVRDGHARLLYALLRNDGEVRPPLWVLPPGRPAAGAKAAILN